LNIADWKNYRVVKLWALLAMFAATSPVSADTAYTTLTYSNVMSFGVSKTVSGVAQVPINGRLFLYGTLVNTSQNSGGAIYRTSSDGAVVETVYQFVETDGYVPQAGVTLGQDNNLYGVTLYAPRIGTNYQAGSGTIFRVGLDGKGFTTLHQFDDLVPALDVQTGKVYGINNDGARPAYALTDGGDGFVYGVAGQGGANGTGTIFRMRLDGTQFQVIHTFARINFSNLTNANYTHEGAFPAGSLVLDRNSGFLYGVTNGGGDAANGTLYRVQTDGSQFQTIFTFEPTNGTISGTVDSTNCHGSVPGGRPLLINDVLYGVTSQGGNDSSNCNGNSTGSTVGFGTIYAVALKDIPGSGLIDYDKFSTIHDFNGTYGQTPGGDLILSQDNITMYGQTSSGSSNSNGISTDLGTVFSLDLRTPASSFNVAYSFSSAGGYTPSGFMVMGNDGYIYGTALSGGACSGGAVFQLRNDGSTNSGGDFSCRTASAAAQSASNSLYGGGSLNPVFLGLLIMVAGVSVSRRLLLNKW
jgi:uncharacterized repeat protein (TIGR03803 family)